MFTKMLKLGTVGACLLLAGTLAHAEPVPGVIRHAEKLPAATRDTYTVNLWGGEVTRVRLVGDGFTPLELRVYDSLGRLVIADTLGGGDRRGVLVLPNFTGTFKVEVRNVGSTCTNTP